MGKVFVSFISNVACVCLFIITFRGFSAEGVLRVGFCDTFLKIFLYKNFKATFKALSAFLPKFPETFLTRKNLCEQGGASCLMKLLYEKLFEIAPELVSSGRVNYHA